MNKKVCSIVSAHTCSLVLGLGRQMKLIVVNQYDRLYKPSIVYYKHD